MLENQQLIFQYLYVILKIELSKDSSKTFPAPISGKRVMGLVDLSI